MPALAKARVYKVTGSDPLHDLQNGTGSDKCGLAKARVYKMTGSDPLHDL